LENRFFETDFSRDMIEPIDKENRFLAIKEKPIICVLHVLSECRATMRNIGDAYTVTMWKEPIEASDCILKKRQRLTSIAWIALTIR